MAQVFSTGVTLSVRRYEECELGYNQEFGQVGSVLGAASRIVFMPCYAVPGHDVPRY